MLKLTLYWWLAIKGLGALCGALYGWRHLRGKASVFFDIGARDGLQSKWRTANRMWWSFTMPAVTGTILRWRWRR